MNAAAQIGLIHTLIGVFVFYYFGLLIGRLIKKVIKKIFMIKEDD